MKKQAKAKAVKVKGKEKSETTNVKKKVPNLDTPPAEIPKMRHSLGKNQTIFNKKTNCKLFLKKFAS